MWKKGMIILSVIFCLQSPVWAENGVDYSEAAYMGQWGNISVSHVADETAAEGKVLKATPGATGTNFWDWGLQTKGNEFIELQPGSTYDIRFRMKAEATRGMFLKCVVTDLFSGDEVEYFGDWANPGLGTEWQSYEFEDVTITNDEVCFLQFQWMGANEMGTFYIDDLQVVLDSSFIVPVEGIQIQDCQGDILRERLQLSATVLPDSATNKGFTWYSSDDSVAMITRSGKVIPRNSGSVEIMVMSDEGGFLDTCSLVVEVTNRTWYVSPEGDDTHTGTGPDAGDAWRTLQHAFSSILPGDTLLLADGTYEENDLLIRNLVADSSKWTLIRSMNPLGAKIQSTGLWTHGVDIRNSAYLEIDGIEAYHSTGTGKGPGISIEEGHELPVGSHHITIRNCYIHDYGCGGINTHTAGDYVLIENNVVRGNAKVSEYNCSGISIYHPVAWDTLPGYHIIVRGNVTYENECDIPFTPGGFSNPTDGNGIIVDDLRFDQNDAYEAYTQKVLIENNLSFNNGGRGIHVYKSDYVTVRNNTCWHNMRILNKYGSKGDLNFGDSKYGALYNNIVVVNDTIPSEAFGHYWTGQNMPLYNNLFVGAVKSGGSFDLKDNIIRSRLDQDYPGLADPTIQLDYTRVEEFRQHFGLRAGSLAREHADDDFAPAFDLEGLPRPGCTSADAGAYEFTDPDNYLPQVWILSPLNGKEFKLGDPVEMELFSSDCDGEVQALELFRNDTLIAEASSAEHVFLLEDEPMGVHRYRVMAMDDAGEWGASLSLDLVIIDTSTVHVPTSSAGSFRVYPNPSEGHLFVEGCEGGRLEVYDLHGRKLVERKKLSQREDLFLGDVPCGTYVLRFTLKGAVEYQKLIIRMP
jgi:parallel beta-helix repeat protein